MTEDMDCRAVTVGPDQRAIQELTTDDLLRRYEVSLKALAGTLDAANERVELREEICRRLGQRWALAKGLDEIAYQHDFCTKDALVTHARQTLAHAKAASPVADERLTKLVEAASGLLDELAGIDRWWGKLREAVDVLQERIDASVNPTGEIG